MRLGRPVTVHAVLFGLLLFIATTSAAALVLSDSRGARAPSSCAGAAATILGTSDGETLQGTPGDDVIVGRRGADLIRGGGGNDIVCGGRGADRLKGGPGNDVLRGNRGDDVARGGDGFDICAAETMFSCNEPLPTPTPTISTSPSPTPTTTPTPSPSVTTSPTPSPSPTSGGGPTNLAPTDIALTNSSVAENEPAGTAVGTLSATDPDAGQTHTFSLVAGVGSTDNASFAIVGNELRTAAEFDLESKSSYSIRVRATDNGSPAMTFDEVFTVTVTGVNDAPVVTTSAGATSYTEGDPATVVDASLIVTDQDDTNLEGATVSIFAGSQAGDELVFANQGGITGNFSAGTLTLTGAASPSTYQTALRSIQFRNTGDDPGTSRTVRFTVDDGDVDSAPADKGISVTSVNDAPVADDETFTGTNGAVGNTALVVNDPTDGSPTLTSPKKTISGDILAGDTDVDGPGPLTVTATLSAPTNDGGTVTIESDGDFIFHPKASTSCTDTSDFFDYTLEDSGSPEMTDTGRVTITISDCVWYVNNNDPAGNSGTSAAPFDTMAQAETASGANDTVFVFDGDNTSTGYATGFAMKAGQRLIGEHEGLVVGVDTLHPANPGAHPTLSATNEDVVDLDDGNEVRGFNLDPQGTGGGIGGSSGDTGGGTIDDVNIVDAGTAGTQPGLELDTTTGTFNISNLTVSTNGATGIRLNNAGTAGFAPTGTISISSANAAGLIATSTNMGTSTFDAITVTGSGAGGVALTDTTGSTTFGDLSLTTTSGSAAAFSVSNGGTISVPTGGTANVSATGGPAVNVTGTAGAALAFDSVSSTNSASDGINLAGLDAGTFSATSGSVSGAPGIAFDLDGGSGDVTYPGALNDGAGATAEITGRSGGTVTLSGAITDTGDAGGGISVTGNTGGSTTFGNASKVLNTTTSPAVTFASSDGHTLSFTGGGLDIDATSGAGINATTSGTLVVSGTGNSITTTTGTALNVTDTDIGASGVTFQSIASNGATNGIVLNNTGSSGGLTVTGTGSAGTGGSIANSTGAGVMLTSTTAPSLSWMSVSNGADDGVRGATVNGFTLSNSTVSTNGNAAGEHGLDFTGGLTGTASVASSTVTVPADTGLIVTDASGSLNLTVTGSTFSATSATTGGDGIQLNANGTANVTASVTGSTFSNNRGNHFQFATNGASSGANGVTFSNNTLTGAVGNLGAGVAVSPDGSSDTTFTIANNNIQGAVSDAVRASLASTSTSGSSLIGTINGNTIGSAAVANSGSSQASGVGVYAEGAGLVTVNVTNNTIRQYNLSGIEVRSASGSPTLNATISGNTTANPGAGAFNGLFMQAGALAGDGGTMCAGISGNTMTGSGANGSTDFRLRQRINTTFRLPNYSGAAGNTAGVVSFVQGNNPSGGTGSATVDFPTTGGGFTGGSALCPTS